MKIKTMKKIKPKTYEVTMTVTDRDIEMLEAFAVEDISQYEKLSKFHVKFKKVYQDWIDKTFAEFQRLWREFD